jgi:hypothetical protein
MKPETGSAGVMLVHGPLAHGIVALTVVIVLHRLLATLTGRSQQLENLVEGQPLLVVEAVGAGTTISRHEPMMELPTRGRDVGEVDPAFFEPSGR